ncbi:hypothetical protein SAY86_026401 [Trapa natans]|uniref:Uncharacterized protein n=1 Tax=Trapa natans TaxID=22666 RepID=A0AAN7KE89_TRANT|nr:hypothetical protein SAY86_026401 [Trapa natans]
MSGDTHLLHFGLLYYFSTFFHEPPPLSRFQAPRPTIPFFLLAGKKLQTMRGPVSLPINGGGREEEEEEEGTDLRRGPWTCEEDKLLVSYIAHHGEGRWNLLANCADDDDRVEEDRQELQAEMAELPETQREAWQLQSPGAAPHPRTPLQVGQQVMNWTLLYKNRDSIMNRIIWRIPSCCRWSKIAQHLPGRTDNEIKNYWRTRVQKQARQLNVESNSKRFLDAFRLFWIPRLLSQKPNSSDNPASPSSTSAVASSMASTVTSWTISPPTRHDVVDQELIPAHYGSSDFRTLISDYNTGDNVSHHQSDFSVDHHPSFDAGVFHNMGSPDHYIISDADAMSSLGGTNSEGSLIFSHVGEPDLMGNVTDDGYWTVGRLW